MSQDESIKLTQEDLAAMRISNGVPIPNPVPTNPGSHMSVKQLLSGDNNRLRYIGRHSTSLVLHRENVAEHSYYVALYSMFICRWMETNTNRRPDRERVLTRAVLHDLDEARTGDFQRPFKYSDPDLQRMIENAAEREFRNTVRGIMPEDADFLNFLTMEWACAKDDSLEGCIVAFADYLSVVGYLWAEVGASNVSLLSNYATMNHYSSIFKDHKFDVIRPLVNQALSLVDKIVERVRSQES